MDASHPTAGTFFSFGKFVNSPRDVMSSGCLLFDGFHPANPLVARERTDVFPRRQSGVARKKGRSHICWNFVNYTVGNAFVSFCFAHWGYFTKNSLD